MTEEGEGKWVETGEHAASQHAAEKPVEPITPVSC